jgi:probable F420-dependent oxidoreductase
MKLDAVGYVPTVDAAGDAAENAERLGYDGWWAAETKADAFLSSAVATQRTERLELGTGIAVAFARNPMTIAMQANELQLLSGGRFMLGLGSQIKAHITRRYSMDWSQPAPRMREFILAIRAIWDAWDTGTTLDFRGDFYTHTLMTPFFNPGPNPHGNPRVILAAVGPKMTEVAGEVADGIFCHFLGTQRYLREVTVPALERGAARSGRSLDGFEILAPGFTVACDTEQELAAAADFVREQIGFYGSTPAYRGVLELHGWGELQDELGALTKRGAWDELATVIDEEVVRTLAIIGTPEAVAAELQRRYGDVATRVNLPAPESTDPDRWASVLETVRGAANAGARPVSWTRAAD